MSFSNGGDHARRVGTFAFMSLGYGPGGVVSGNGPPRFIDLTADLVDAGDSTGWSSRIMRQNELQKYDSGELSLKLFDGKGMYDPDNPTGPWYGQLIPDNTILLQHIWPWQPGLLTDANFDTTGLSLLTMTNVSSATVLHGTKMGDPGVTRDARAFANVNTLHFQATATAAVKIESQRLFYDNTKPITGIVLMSREGASASTWCLAINFYDSGGSLTDSVTSGFQSLLQYSTTNPAEFTMLTTTVPVGTAVGAAVSFSIEVTTGTSPTAGQGFMACGWVAAQTTAAKVWTEMTGYVDSYEVQQAAGAQAVYRKISCHDAFKFFGIAGINSCGYPQQILSQSPTIYYRLTDISGAARALDSVTGHLNGALLGLPPGVEFGIPGALIADSGTAANFAIGDEPTGFIADTTTIINLGSGAFTISFWFATTVITDTGDSHYDEEAFFELLTPTLPSVDAPSLLMELIPFTVSGGPLGPPPTVLVTAGDGVMGHTIEFEVANPTWLDFGWHYMTLERDATGLIWSMTVDGVGQVLTDLIGGTGGLAFTQTTVPAFSMNGMVTYIGATLQGTSTSPVPTYAGWMQEFAINVGANALTFADVLANFNLGRNVWINENAGQRIATVAQAIGWAGATDIDVADTIQLQPQTTQLASADPEQAQNGLDYMQKVEETEAGQLFMSRAGSLTFRSRHSGYKPPKTTPLFILSNRHEIGTIPYEDISPQYDDTLIYNQSELTRVGGSPVIWPLPSSAKTQSQLEHFIRTSTHDALMMDSDSTALGLAQFEVMKFSEARRRNRKIKISTSSADIDDMVIRMLADVNPTDRLQVRQFMPWATSTPIVTDGFVEGIEVTGGVGSIIDVVYDLAFVDPNSYLLLDDVTGRGIFDSNRWGF